MPADLDVQDSAQTAGYGHAAKAGLRSGTVANESKVVTVRDYHIIYHRSFGIPVLCIVAKHEGELREPCRALFL